MADQERLVTAMATVEELMRSPTDPYHDRLIASYSQIRRFLPGLIAAIDFEATESAAPILTALGSLDAWFQDQPRTTTKPVDELPGEVITTGWEPHVITDTGDVNRAAYTCCVLDGLRKGLRRRDIYTPNSIRWGDPRAELIDADVWDQQRDQACAGLALDPDPANVISRLSQALDGAWRRLGDGMETNPDFKIEHRDGQDRIVITPLDAVEEPASLIDLRRHVDALEPEVEIADVPLEVHGWTGFLNEYTHISGAQTRTEGLLESIAALLVSDACNIGLTPVIDEHHPPLSRDRLNWVAQNYLRADTHARASHTTVRLPRTTSAGS